MFLPTHAQVVVGPEIAYSSKVHVDRAAPTSTGPDNPSCWWGWAVWKPWLRFGVSFQELFSYENFKTISPL